jgi:predicted deacylase
MTTTKKGSKESGWLEFKYPPTGELIRFPVGTVYGVEDGPTLVVLGGMHGSEYCGIEAAIQLFNWVDPAKLRGTLMVGMIYNLPAFQNNQGFVVPQDGINPGRTFPGKLDGSFSQVMAYYFNQEFLSKADYYVELHGGDIPEALVPWIYAPITGNDAVDEKIKAMAQAYNIALVCHGKVPQPPPSTGSGFIMTALRGVPAILTESGQQGILNLEDAERHLTGLRNVLIHLNMMDGEMVSTVKHMISEQHQAIRSEHVGMWYPYVNLGDWVKQDQVVGQIRDYFGDPVFDVKAVFDGHVTVIRTSPNIGIGNVLIELDRVTSKTE